MTFGVITHRLPGACFSNMRRSISLRLRYQPQLPGMSPMNRIPAYAVALLLVATASSCRIGTDVPADEMPELELTEAEDVISEVLVSSLQNSILSANHVSFAHSHGATTLHSHPVSGPYIHDLVVDGPQLGHHNLFEFDLVLDTPCSVGGSVLIEAAVTGEGNPAVQPGSVHYIMIQTHADCVIPLSDGSGEDFILNASPYLTVEAHATNAAGVLSLFGSIEGDIAWEGDAKGGVCEMKLDYSATGASMDEITEIPVTGTFCDLDLDVAVPLS
jgi:hypothetical protein